MLKIKVIGSGCKTCEKLEDLCRKITADENLNSEIEKVTDINQFADLGIFVTPGLIINDEIKVQGKLPTEATLRNWFMKADTI